MTPRRSEVESLAEMMAEAGRVTVLTGAGCSTASGIPDYRGPNGTWTRRRPILFSDFVRSEDRRRNFWARNYRGWPRFSNARPNPAHLALARLEELGRVELLVTQNVDDLHQRAGSRRLLPLHGSSTQVVCLSCRATLPRTSMQSMLEKLNPDWDVLPVGLAPDGDAELDPELTRSFRVPDCPRCGGLLKPDVVFFGEAVPKDRVEATLTALDRSAMLLVVGSSLTVWSGYRFAVAARERGRKVAIINQGETRADAIADVRVEGECGCVLTEMLNVEL
jgi:NAD-dependent SIR2 family protein deacetylase